MKMGYYWDERGRRRVRFDDGGDSDPASEYNEAAADFIESGEWGWLNEDANRHLLPFRARYLAMCAKDKA